MFEFGHGFTTLLSPIYTAKKKKTHLNMTRQSWTTEGECKWLTEMIPNFLAAQENKTSSSFWPRVYEGYAEKFPIAAPTADKIKGADNNKELATCLKKKAIEKVRNEC